VRLIPKILLSLGFAALPALCGPIAPGQWYYFSWQGLPTQPTTGTTVASPWTFSGPGTLLVQDRFTDGDQFAIYDNAIFQGLTSVPSNDWTYCGPDPVVCGMDSKFSQGTFNFGSGDHSITILLSAGAVGYAYGTAAFMLTSEVPPPPSEVPEPTTLGLVSVGFGGLLLRRWRAQRRS
jgi:hypothetical protein